MSFGSFNPFPQKLGGSKASYYEALLDALNQGDGNGLTDEIDTFNYAENLALARMITDIYFTANRLRYTADPDKMTDSIPDWEYILKIVPIPGSTDNQRRAVIKAKLAILGETPTFQVINDLLTVVLDGIYEEIVVQTAATVNSTVPGGVTIPGGVTLADGDWRSTLSYIPIKVSQPAYMDDATFYKLTANIHQYLPDIMPAWTTFDWFIVSPLGPGFFLDVPNLDLVAFSE